MLKRFAVVIVVAALAIGLIPTVSAAPKAQLSTCGTDQNVTLTFIAGQVGDEHNLYVKLANEYTANVCPNITVNVVERPTSTTDTLAQYQQFFAAQSPDLDMFMVDVAWPGLISEHLLDMGSYLSQDQLSRFYPKLIDTYTLQGRLVALPWFVDAGMLYYRTDLLTKYNLDVPQTWDDLYTAASTIQKGERDAGNADFWGFVYQGAAYEGLTCDALEWQVSNGDGTIINPDGTIEVNNAATIEIFDKMASWVGDVVPPQVVTYQEEDSRAVWQAGNAAFMRNWPYAYPLGEASDSVIKDKFSVGPLPGKTAGMSAATLGGWGISVSKYSANPEAAVALANWLTSNDALVELLPPKGGLPVLPDLYQNQDLLAAMPYLAFTTDILSSATARPGSVAGTQYATVSEDYYTAVNNILAGSTDATTAMSDLELKLADLGFTIPKAGS
jgi:trehalose/maltose transport system substrate-binding protein